jgi:hypothetical protein
LSIVVPSSRSMIFRDGTDARNSANRFLGLRGKKDW